MLSKDRSERMNQVSTELAKLNPILAKLDTCYAAALYQSFLSFAKHIARASGGILRFLTIGPKEHKVVELPMIEEFLQNYIWLYGCLVRPGKHKTL